MLKKIPMQYKRDFRAVKISSKKIFSCLRKNRLDLGGSNKYPQFMFRSEDKKNVPPSTDTPVLLWDLRGIHNTDRV